MDADAGMRGAWATRNHADAWSACEFAIGFRHTGRSALVLGYDQVDLTFVMQRVQHFQVAFSRDAENPFDTM
jgi:hypothetical protein